MILALSLWPRWITHSDRNHHKSRQAKSVEKKSISMAPRRSECESGRGTLHVL